MSQLATGPSRAATGSITANTDSTLTLADPSSQVLISNHGAVQAYVRINGPCNASTHDMILGVGDRAWIEDVVIETVHVYMNATSGIRVVYW